MCVDGYTSIQTSEREREREREKFGMLNTLFMAWAAATFGKLQRMFRHLETRSTQLRKRSQVS